MKYKIFYGCHADLEIGDLLSKESYVLNPGKVKVCQTNDDKNIMTLARSKYARQMTNT